MPDIAPLVDQLNYLCSGAGRVVEDSFRITIEGSGLDRSLVDCLLGIRKSADGLGIPAPSVLVDERTVDQDDLVDVDELIGEPWRLILGKTALAEQFRVRDVETTVLFFSVHGFDAWLKGLDPFVQNSTYDPDFSGPTTIRVVGLEHSFGGPLLWVLPTTNPTPADISPTNLPESSAVHSLIHINADRLMSVCPKGWALTWGDLNQAAAAQLTRLSAMVLSACLVQEIKRSDAQIVATLRGTKLISLPLPVNAEEENIASLLPTLIESIEWVYAERAETRLKLVTDRLSIDIQLGQALLSGMQLYLGEALKQARDSYAFVILERKDAYHKEMRDLMKDMKAQADLYAAKVRDLVSSLTRDILGVLVFLGFSFIGRFDQSHLKVLLSSGELSLLMKVLAGYLVLSCVLQLVTHWRDADLSYAESQRWLSVLQNYTSRTENQERFIDPIDQRKWTLYFAMLIIGGLYALVAILVWNLPFVARLLLAQ